MTTTNRSRNQRNNPYALDGLFVSFHHSAAGVAWRWRTELAILAALAAALWRLATLITITWAGIALAALTAALFTIPATRRFISRRFWCVLGRHRLQRLCVRSTPAHPLRPDPAGPGRPTKVGERAHILCRAGVCAEDFEMHIGELRAACSTPATPGSPATPGGPSW